MYNRFIAEPERLAEIRKNRMTSLKKLEIKNTQTYKKFRMKLKVQKIHFKI